MDARSAARAWQVDNGHREREALHCATEKVLKIHTRRHIYDDSNSQDSFGGAYE